MERRVFYPSYFLCMVFGTLSLGSCFCEPARQGMIPAPPSDVDWSTAIKYMPHTSYPFGVLGNIHFANQKYSITNISAAKDFYFPTITLHSAVYKVTLTFHKTPIQPGIYTDKTLSFVLTQLQDPTKTKRIETGVVWNRHTHTKVHQIYVKLNRYVLTKEHGIIYLEGMLEVKLEDNTQVLYADFQTNVFLLNWIKIMHLLFSKRDSHYYGNKIHELINDKEVIT